MCAAKQALAFQAAQYRVDGALLDHHALLITRAYQFSDLVAVKGLFALGQDAQQGQTDRARTEFFLEFLVGFL